jgi:hypothetical protein
VHHCGDLSSTEQRTFSNKRSLMSVILGTGTVAKRLTRNLEIARKVKIYCPTEPNVDSRDKERLHRDDPTMVWCHDACLKTRSRILSPGNSRGEEHGMIHSDSYFLDSTIHSSTMVFTNDKNISFVRSFVLFHLVFPARVVV